MTVTRIAFVKEYTDRTGKLRRYFRKRGRKPVALPGAPGSPGAAMNKLETPSV
jgi:hypothetical protein